MKVLLQKKRFISLWEGKFLWYEGRRKDHSSKSSYYNCGSLINEIRPVSAIIPLRLHSANIFNFLVVLRYCSILFILIIWFHWNDFLLPLYCTISQMGKIVMLFYIRLLNLSLKAYFFFLETFWYQIYIKFPDIDKLVSISPWYINFFTTGSFKCYSINYSLFSGKVPSIARHYLESFALSVPQTLP